MKAPPRFSIPRAAWDARAALRFDVTFMPRDGAVDAAGVPAAAFERLAWRPDGAAMVCAPPARFAPFLRCRARQWATRGVTIAEAGAADLFARSPDR